ncbi:unnamed protein product [Dovyalis caffra]|uniref:CAP-Gly domain-containing protein n=1 Tax=Dovyalis caffra TaxID=77055 RepID=A0AAV1R608_9ROSI|nr:unnamed protein product [Dovyalis caffra]
MQSSSELCTEPFKLGQRVHSATDSRRIGTVKYIGPVDGYAGTWVGVDWDNGEAKHDGSLNAVRYFQARSQLSGSFVRAQNLSPGISLVEALYIRYRDQSTKEEEDEMYVLSASNKKVSVQLVGQEKIQDKLSRLEGLTGASLSYLGVSNPGSPNEINNIVPRSKTSHNQTDRLHKETKLGDKTKQSKRINLQKCEETKLCKSRRAQATTERTPPLTGREATTTPQGWQKTRRETISSDVGTICEQLPSLAALNLSNNLMAHEIVELRIEVLKDLLPIIEELHLMGNGINTIKDVRLSENPIADPGRGGFPRFILIARLAKVEILNGSEVNSRVLCNHFFSSSFGLGEVVVGLTYYHQLHLSDMSA